MISEQVLYSDKAKHRKEGGNISILNGNRISKNKDAAIILYAYFAITFA